MSFLILDLNIWWSVPQFAQRIVRVLQMSILSRHLVMTKSIICPCQERGCVQMVLSSSFCLNMVLVSIISNAVQSANRNSPLELHFPIPYLSKAEGQLSFSRPILALKSPISRSLAVLGKFCVYPLADCKCLLVLLGVRHCWIICTDYCSIPVFCQRDSQYHNPITHYMWHFCQLCHDVPF